MRINLVNRREFKEKNENFNFVYGIYNVSKFCRKNDTIRCVVDYV